MNDRVNETDLAELWAAYVRACQNQATAERSLVELRQQLVRSGLKLEHPWRPEWGYIHC